jgi:DNA-binding transcriptional ArsR family regulator
MLRIHFTERDIANLTIEERPDPLWELLLSVHTTQHHEGELQFGRWRRWTAGAPREDAALLRELAPATGYSPDFLTPVRSAPDFDTAVDLVLGTPAQAMRAQLGHLARRRGRVTPWVDDLARGVRGSRRRLGRALRAYHERALKPYWPSLRDNVLADRSRRMHLLATEGVDAVLSTLHPGVIWDPPVLGVRDFADTDVRLDGRGLRLVPSLFCWQAPTKLHDAELPPVLVYPTDAPPGTLHRTGDNRRANLEALLGRTRAIALEATAAGCSTTGLAVRCGVSVATASHHASVLREAGLISSRREGGGVLHEITALGLALLGRS